MLKRLLLLSLFLPFSLAAQSVRYQSQLIGSRGLPLANQTVAVCTQPANTTTQPCSPLATLGTSAATSSGGANPLTTDSLGNFFFYVPTGTGKVTIQIYGPQVSNQFVQPDVVVPPDISQPTVFGSTVTVNSTLTATNIADTSLTVGNCVQATTGGQLVSASGPCGTSSGTITATGSPVSGNLTKFSGPTSVTNGDLLGDCTTTGTLAITCTKTAGTTFAPSATVDTTTGANISFGGTTITKMQILVDNIGLSCSGDQVVCTKTLTWPSSWVNTNYTAVCNPVNPSNTSGAQSVSWGGSFNQTTTQISVAITSNGSAGGSFGGFVCWGIHQ